MDPNAALKEWWRAVLEENREAANEAYFNIRSWLERGGFEPDWTKYGQRFRQTFFRYNPRTGRVE